MRLRPTTLYQELRLRRLYILGTSTAQEVLSHPFMYLPISSLSHSLSPCFSVVLGILRWTFLCSRVTYSSDNRDISNYTPAAACSIHEWLMQGASREWERNALFLLYLLMMRSHQCSLRGTRSLIPRAHLNTRLCCHSCFLIPSDIIVSVVRSSEWAHDNMTFSC